MEYLCNLDRVSNADIFTFKDNYVEHPERPNFGIEVYEEYVREQVQTHVNWYNLVWHHEGGTVVEW